MYVHTIHLHTAVWWTVNWRNRDGTCECVYACMIHMDVYMYICVLVCMFVCMFVWLYVCRHECVYACMIHMDVCIYVCVYVCMSVCLYVCLFDWMYVDMNVCMSGIREFMCAYLKWLYVKRGSWGIFGDSSFTLAQWWRARDFKFWLSTGPRFDSGRKHINSDSHGFEQIDPQARVLNYCFH